MKTVTISFLNYDEAVTFIVHLKFRVNNKQTMQVKFNFILIRKCILEAIVYFLKSYYKPSVMSILESRQVERLNLHCRFKYAMRGHNSRSFPSLSLQ